MKNRLIGFFTWFALVGIYGCFLLAYAPIRFYSLFVRPRRRSASGGKHILIIGTFYTRNWCIAHLSPLSKAEKVHSIVAVVDGPTEPMNGVRYVHPPAKMTRLFGRAVVKFFCALRSALHEKPDLVMGYHLLPGAMTALLVARLVGARAGYQLTAGPIELIDGGAATENFFLKNLVGKSRILESLAVRIASCFDLLVVRGGKGRRFLMERELGQHVRVIPGSLDPERFASNDHSRCYDVVCVCRLVPIKQPGHFAEVLSRLRLRVPDFRAVILGDGPLRSSLEEEIDRLGIADNVTVCGHVEDVEQYLKRSKVFLLTSRSEGLSIAMAEAMAAGVVPVVADVGELSDLVRNGETGWRVPEGAFDDYAQRIAEVVTDPRVFHALSCAASRAAIKHNGVEAVARKWSRTIEVVCKPATQSRPGRRAWTAGLMPSSTSRRRLWEKTPQAMQDILSPVASRLPPAYWLGASFRRHSLLLAQAQWWSAEQYREHILKNVQRVCEEAYEWSSYYQECFDAKGFEPGDLQNLEDLRGLPTIDRHTLQHHLKEMTTVPKHNRGTEIVSTGGTSGKPLSFRIGLDRSAIEYAYLTTSWRRSGFVLPVAQAVFRGEIIHPNRDGLRHRYDPILRRHYYSSFHMSEQDVRRYFVHIETIGPCFLSAYPSTVTMLARFVDSGRVPAPRNLRGILAGSENIYPDDRALAERVFGVRYFSWYGHTEKVVMAAECEHSTDYHVWPTYGYFELLDDQGNAVTTPGQRGEIVGTGFINRVVPFIRYRTGDYATYVSDRCDACGRAHPIIRDTRGHRDQELLVARDRSVIPWSALNMHDDTFDRVRQFQCRQERAGEAVLRVVPVNGFNEDDRQRILRNFHRKIGGRIDLTIEITDSIPLSARGKAIYVDQRIDLDQLLNKRTNSR